MISYRVFIFIATPIFDCRARLCTYNHFFSSNSKNGWQAQLLVLLSKAGLRAAEIANLTWQMVVDPTGEIGCSLELHDRVAKKGSGRVIPIHPDLRVALFKLARPPPAATSLR
jgi:integrase